MPKSEGAVRRDGKHGRIYFIPEMEKVWKPEGELKAGEAYSVTTKLGALGKGEGLMHWAAKIQADAAIELSTEWAVADRRILRQGVDEYIRDGLKGKAKWDQGS